MRELLDEGVVAVGEEALAHGFCVFAIAERADLDVDEFVLGLGVRGDGVAFAVERAD